MKTTTARSVPQANGRDGYDWISPQDVVRHALAAYYYCCRDSDAYPVDPSDPEDVASRLQHSRREFAVFLGERFAERVMTVVRTARKQGKDVLDFIFRSIKARIEGTTTPRLLGALLTPCQQPP